MRNAKKWIALVFTLCSCGIRMDVSADLEILTPYELPKGMTEREFALSYILSVSK